MSQDPEQEEEMPAPAVKRQRPAWLKRKVAVMMGFCGTGYQGMQLNPGAHTIEKELFKALVEEQLVSEDNAEDPKKVAWMRACRTDKGVHACGQVVSLKILMRDDYEDLVEGNDDKKTLERITEALNERLPEAIRIFGMKRTVGSFHAKERTDSRIYEYLLPTYTLRPTAIEPYQAEPRERGPNDRWDGLVCEISDEERAALKAWRAPAELLEQTRDLFKAYIGHHPFHNFTIGIDASEMKANRYIMEVNVGEPFVRNELEWVRIRFHGQSFMLHQIRKMVGLAVLAARLSLSPSIITKCLRKDVKVNVPRAPALGLLLDRAIFAQYNQRNASNDPIDFLEYEAEREQLKESLIYPKIFGEEEKACSFWGWLKCNDDHAADFSFLTRL